MASMNRQFFGMPSLPLSTVYVRAALALLAEAGINLQKRRIVKPEEFENRITYRLEYEMRIAQQKGLSDMLQFAVRPNMPYNPVDPLDRCEIDIKFDWFEYPQNPERYLAVEAKKLYGRGGSLAGDYVEEGVMDFVNGKYSSGHNYGIMLGYIVLEPRSVAVSAVEVAMNKRKVMTNEQQPFSLNNSFCSHPDVYHSTHLPISDAPIITLIHLFLDLF